MGGFVLYIRFMHSSPPELLRYPLRQEQVPEVQMDSETASMQSESTSHASEIIPTQTTR